MNMDDFTIVWEYVRVSPVDSVRPTVEHQGSDLVSKAKAMTKNHSFVLTDNQG